VSVLQRRRHNSRRVSSQSSEWSRHSSMDIDELVVQREGYAQAIVSKEFLRALNTGPNGRLAVSYFEWSASGDQKIILPWRLIDDQNLPMQWPPRSCNAGSPGHPTSISGAINFACRCTIKIHIAGPRRVIDISGDGANNEGDPVTGARCGA